MFEKEAEEYADKDFGMYEPTDHERYAKETDWRNGAEFGFNKAKEEWKKHFMQCSSPFCLDIFSSVKCCGELGNMAKKEGEEKNDRIREESNRCY